jgi:hypothetical protein
MNKKTIIELVIIAAAFFAAGLVLYNGFFNGNNNASLLAETAGNSPAAQQDILPYGNTLNYDSTINPKRFQYSQIEYPQVDSRTEIGIFEANLIPPAPQPAK